MEEFLSSPPGNAALGVPIPYVPHALSVSLPVWQNIIDWAERKADVINVMSTGYPRFFIHKSIQELADICLELLKNDSDSAMLFPTARIAEDCSLLIKRYAPSGTPPAIQVVHFELEHKPETEFCAVIFPPELFSLAKSFWAQAGLGISSRYADRLLEGLAAGFELRFVDEPLRGSLNVNARALGEKSAIKRRIANLINGGDCPSGTSDPTDFGVEHDGAVDGKRPATEDHVYLYPSGVAAIWHAHQLNLAFRPGCKCILFGFPYSDTTRILKRWGPGIVPFFKDPDTNLAALEDFLPGSSVTALFCEVPSNPILQCPDLPRIRELADRYGFLVVVDDTVGNFINVDVFGFADILVTSLSKLFSGSANVMGGSLVINPNSRHFAFMRDHVSKTFVDDYYHEDAVVMEENSRDFAARVRIINANTEAVCDYLRTRSLTFGGPQSSNRLPDHAEFVIKDVFYPKWVSRRNYDLCRRHNSDNNFGPLFSLTFTSPSASRAFYDALQCAKGPSLGANFTLSCPYSVLVHYNELEWAAGHGVDEDIVRVSVGMEERQMLLGWMETALSAAEKTKQAS
ncbi:hypothetical protein M0805_004888 [Coniferiporia weirii]|nr:hypothetical protein M0805_004888 [Coniferiporia weirii]